MFLFFLFGATAYAQPTISEYYQLHRGNMKPSVSKGTAGKGSLENGKLLPYYGPNFFYFDSSSYVNGRAFLNDKILLSLLSTYVAMDQLAPYRMYGVMECSLETGGKLYPHRTHQNGLSVDFMMPLIQDGNPYYALDTIGTSHYLLDFNDDGTYSSDSTVRIDFNLVALHLLTLNEEAQRNGYKISKVIIKIELKDDLYATPNGKKLREKGIYIVQSLTPEVNNVHDDHYHVDFEKISP